MISFARILIILGLVLIIVGGAVYLAARAGLPLGRLPGDIRVQTENITCVFPLATSIILSILLTILLNIIVRFFNR